MLDLNTIKEVSGQREVSEVIIEKDYILDWLLWGLSQIEEFRTNFIFKGATLLHKMYFSDWRFSEDLDFTTIKNLKEDEIRKMISLCCKTVQERSGIVLDCKEISSSGEWDNQIWSFEVKIEYVGPRKQERGSKPVVKIHITNDEPLLKEPHLKPFLRPWKDIPPNFIIFTYSLEEVMAEKIRTVLHQRCHAKDVYDVWRLLKEYKSFINIPVALEIYSRKCKYRNIVFGIPDNLSERIDRLKDHWDKGLTHLLKETLDFNTVSIGIRSLIEDIFSEKYSKKGGIFKMLETNYQIRYKRGDLEIEVHGDKDFVESKFKELLELKKHAEGKQPIPTEETRTIQPSDTEKELSISEFLKTKDAKSHGDKILVFAYYLEKYEKIRSFNVDDLERCYRDVRVPKTKNLPHYIAQLTSDSYITDAEEKKNSKKAWELTDKGIECVKSLSQEGE